ncbi:hypothetical protein ZIOFF_073254 [Zingiber officinale]|uniref:Histidine-containing phosphotransfer protein n=1 Tax=Zingiber officinale TaxID=94328 RepID=A0A8J5BZV2_ZINOF|nr:hypothetical protein ZIOFF_073254 [Zingiber officinale]
MGARTNLQRRYLDFTSPLFHEVVDFKKVDAHVHQFKGNSASNKMILATDSKSLFFPLPCSIGAQRVKNVCMAFHNYCEEMDHEGCLTCLQQLKQEYFLVKNKLETLFKLEQQIVAAGGSIPMMW